MPAFVYLLPHAVHPRFKIGKANDMLARIGQLGRAQFDFARSRALRVSTPEDAWNLERVLHRAFAKVRLSQEVVCAQEGMNVDGSTEWFDSSCQNRLNQFLAENADLLDFAVVETAELNRLLEPPARPIKIPTKRVAPLEKAEDGESRADFLARRHTEDCSSATKHAQALLPTFVAIAECCDDLRLELSSYKGVASLIGHCQVEHQPRMKELFDELFASNFKGSSGSFRLVSSVTMTQSKTVFKFDMSLAWPSGARPSAYECAAEALAALPLAIPGWSWSAGQATPDYGLVA